MSKIYLPTSKTPTTDSILGAAFHELLSNAEFSTALASGRLHLSDPTESLLRSVMLDLEVQGLVVEMPV